MPAHIMRNTRENNMNNIGYTLGRACKKCLDLAMPLTKAVAHHGSRFITEFTAGIAVDNRPLPVVEQVNDNTQSESNEETTNYHQPELDGLEGATPEQPIRSSIDSEIKAELNKEQVAPVNT
tara:strand:- start:2187 stop:2552 length:366 start_codon:yes stop_codon:yes gene_type:complete